VAAVVFEHTLRDALESTSHLTERSMSSTRARTVRTWSMSAEDVLSANGEESKSLIRLSQARIIKTWPTRVEAE